MVALDELGRLNEHSARATCRVKYATMVRLEHFYKGANDT